MGNPITTAFGALFLLLKLASLFFPDLQPAFEVGEGAAVAGGLATAADAKTDGDAPESRL